MTKPVNPKSPWRRKHGGLGPLTDKQLEQEPDDDNSNPIPGVLDAEFFETPRFLTKKDLEELL